MRADPPCIYRVTLAVTLLWPMAATAQAVNTAPAPATLQAPTLGQLSDAQARKAREEWLKARAIEATPAHTAPLVTPPPTSTQPVRTAPSYTIDSIYSLPGQPLQADISINGQQHTVRPGDQLPTGAIVKDITPDNVLIERSSPPPATRAGLRNQKQKP